MSDFLNRFLLEEGRKLQPESGRYLALGVFGKHPGWDDHIEDLGLETDSLTLAKRVFYIQGVGGQIDAGAWEKLKEEQRLPAFDHVFLWQRSGQFLAGRLWSSSDGKGRTRYPMIVCAHCVGAPLTWVLETVLPRLAEVERACRATDSAAEVRAILEEARSGLRAALGGAAPQDSPIASEALGRFVSDPGFGEGQLGWFRFLYAAQSQLAEFNPGKPGPKSDLQSLRAQAVRVPLGSASTGEVFRLWSRFLAGIIDPAIPCFMVVPAGQTWIDLVAGRPSTQDFFCLRAGSAALPLVTDVPYQIDTEFKVRAAQLLADFQAGRTPSALAQSSAKPAPSPGGASKTRWWSALTGKKLGLLICGAGLLLVAAVVISQMGSGSKPGASTLAKQTATGADQEKSARPAVADAKRQADGEALQQEKDEQARLAAADAAAREEAMTATAEAKRQAEVQQQKDEQARQAAADVAAKVKAMATAAEVKRQTEAQRQKDEEARQAAVEAARVQAEAAAKDQMRITNETKAVPLSSAAPAPASSPPSNLTNGVGMALVWVRSLPATSAGAWVGKFEVTQREYERVTGSNPSAWEEPLQPVENVTWDEAVSFCHKLTELEGRSGTLPQGFGYSLPTEAQWEFLLGDAQFEGSVTSREVNHSAPVAVGSTRVANQYGLFDVLGNVWEWCADTGTSQRLLKGGAFDSSTRFNWSKPFERTTVNPKPAETRSPNAGFRCVLTPTTANM